MNDVLPARAGKFAKDNPDIWKAYQELGKACTEGGPLDGRSCRLVKIALAAAAGSVGAVHSHTRRAISEGLSADELRHVALLAVPTLGFAKAVAMLTWIDDIVGGEGSS
jgi:alkylhydroperoxidase/carboxymuconolactone decarboxylase family protein YurZ